MAARMRSLPARPVDAGGRNRGNGSLAEAITTGRARFCAWSGNNWTAAPGTVAAGTLTTSGTGFFVRPGFRFYLTGLSLSADAECQVSGRIAPDSSGDWYGYLGKAGNNQLPYYIDLGMTLAGGAGTMSFPAGFPIGENASFTFFYRTSGTVARRISFVATGYEVPTDRHPDAAVRVVVVGDSNSAWANMGVDAQGRSYLGRDTWTTRLISRARAAGADACLFANYAEDGRTLQEMWYNLITGQYAADWDRMIVAGGTNDAVSTKYSGETKIREAVQGIIDYRDREYPGEGKRILFCAPPATDDADRLGANRLANVRQYIADVVAANGGEANGIGHCDLSQGVVLNAAAAADTNYKHSERVAGSRVHLSGLGSTAIGQYVFDQRKAFLFGL